MKKALLLILLVIVSTSVIAEEKVYKTESGNLIKYSDKTTYEFQEKEKIWKDTKKTQSEYESSEKPGTLQYIGTQEQFDNMGIPSSSLQNIDFQPNGFTYEKKEFIFNPATNAYHGKTQDSDNRKKNDKGIPGEGTVEKTRTAIFSNGQVAQHSTTTQYNSEGQVVSSQSTIIASDGSRTEVKSVAEEGKPKPDLLDETNVVGLDSNWNYKPKVGQESVTYGGYELDAQGEPKLDEDGYKITRHSQDVSRMSDSTGTTYVIDTEGNVKEEKIDPLTDEKTYTDVAKEGKCPAGNKLCEKITDEQSDFKQERFLGDLSDFTSTASGYAGYSSLFMEDEALTKWRNSIDQYFGNYLGIESWSSMICDSHISSVSDDFAIIRNKGQITAGAHVEGERTEELSYRYYNETTDQTESKGKYLYKISFFITNPSTNDDNEINLLLKGATTHYLYDEWREVASGESYSASRETMITFYDDVEWDTICIEMKEAIFSYDGEKISNPFCNRITQI